jgi:hypothetical protein
MDISRLSTLEALQPTLAGSEPGEIPLTLDGLDMTAPEHPLEYPPIGLA